MIYAMARNLSWLLFSSARERRENNTKSTLGAWSQSNINARKFSICFFFTPSSPFQMNYVWWTTKKCAAEIACKLCVLIHGSTEKSLSVVRANTSKTFICAFAAIVLIWKSVKMPAQLMNNAPKHICNSEEMNESLCQCFRLHLFQLNGKRTYFNKLKSRLYVRRTAAANKIICTISCS